MDNDVAMCRRPSIFSALICIANYSQRRLDQSCRMKQSSQLVLWLVGHPSHTAQQLPLFLSFRQDSPHPMHCNGGLSDVQPAPQALMNKGLMNCSCGEQALLPRCAASRWMCCARESSAYPSGRGAETHWQCWPALYATKGFRPCMWDARLPWWPWCPLEPSTIGCMTC